MISIIGCRRTGGAPTPYMNSRTTSPHGAVTASSYDAPIIPVYLRLPKPPAKCPVTGLCRSTIWKLIAGVNPPVKSKILKVPGSSRGIRMVETKALISHIDSLPDSAQIANEEGGCRHE